MLAAGEGDMRSLLLLLVLGVATSAIDAGADARLRDEYRTVPVDGGPACTYRVVYYPEACMVSTMGFTDQTRFDNSARSPHMIDCDERVVACGEKFTCLCPLPDGGVPPAKPARKHKSGSR